MQVSTTCENNFISKIKIGSRILGPGAPVFLIAEAGVNHNGDAGMAEKLVDQAVLCGADCIKFQTYKTERIITKNAPKARYQLNTTDPDESQMAMLKKLELPLNDYQRIFERCREKNILFLSTPYSEEDIDFLDALGVPAFKVASGQAVESHFLKHLARKKKPILLSTGMCTLAEVDEAVRTIKSEGNNQVIVLQCTTNYPSALTDCNLKAMKTMADAFGVLSGYSDHTRGITACIAAAALGAHVIEKHFTLDRNATGPDHQSSSDPPEFQELVKGVRDVEACLGSFFKQPTSTEKENALGMRRSLVARTNINKGEKLSWKNVTMKRPGSGLTGGNVCMAVGMIAREDIPEDTLISFEMLK